ncbi:hypothetical protein [Malikia spinosa]|uniref:Uncharacterized protein n=1 Tax=Malikia spinosa TaxID=86180 RepID=A0A7C9NCQ3_9BURK|nr:hypothetical protein [Malikia spinosa]MYZ53685.1 hypothetical protein [Malikia spinosa]
MTDVNRYKNLTNKQARELVRTHEEAVWPAYISLLGGNRPLIVEIENDVYLIALLNQEGEVLKYGLMDEASKDALLDDLSEIRQADYEYACTYSAGFKYCYYSNEQINDYVEYELNSWN